MYTFALEREQVIGFPGALLLMFGCFAPLYQLPFIGAANYIGNGTSDGVFVLALACIAAALLAVRAYTFVIAPAIGVTVICTYTLYGFFGMQAEIHRSAESGGGLFGAFAEALASSISLQWGWLMIVIGLASLMVVSVLGLFKAQTAAQLAATGTSQHQGPHPISKGPNNYSWPDAPPGHAAITQGRDMRLPLTTKWSPPAGPTENSRPAYTPPRSTFGKRQR